ncbi:MAG TPA: GNAT family N-acetyltransferase [Pseudonocardiaceae bacterium]|nr:GNAT family N-acetyltransferase [Pseudonocardiaceae bacterium]
MPSFTDPVVPRGRLRGLVQPTITVDELVLRPWQASDAPAVVDAYRDPDIQRWHVRSMTEAEALAWVLSWADHWAAETGAGWAVEVDGMLAGRMNVGALDLAEGHGAAAYWVVPAARGRRVAPRALAAVTEWLFAEIGLHRITLEHSTHNTASCLVAARAGYTAEGTNGSAGLHVDGWHDMHLHARINERPGHGPHYARDHGCQPCR